MTELRVYLQIDDLQPQFAAYMSTPLRARGYPPFEGEHSLIIEVAPALLIHRIVDLALKVAPELEPGILYTERQFGLLELHDTDQALLAVAGQAILNGIGVRPEDQLRPVSVYVDIIENIADQHAILLNRTRGASMLVPGQSLLLYEIVPALFAAMAANEAERIAPESVLVDVQMMGATGRVFLAGKMAELIVARDHIAELLQQLPGRG